MNNSEELIEILMEPKFKSRIAEEIIANNIMLFNKKIEGGNEKGEEDIKEEIKKMIQQGDVREIFVEKIIIILNQIINDQKNQIATEEKAISFKKQKRIIEMIETLIKWGIIPNLHFINVKENEEEFDDDSVFNSQINQRENKNQIKNCIEILLICVQNEEMNFIIKEYMKYLFAGILEIGMEEEKMKLFRQFISLEESIKGLIQLISENKNDRIKIQKELLRVVIERNGLIYILKYFSEKEFEEIPEQISIFILSQLFYKEDQLEFYSYVLNNYKQIIDLKILPKSCLKLLYYLILPSKSIDQFIDQILIDSINSINSVIKQKRLNKRKIEIEDKERIMFEIINIGCFNEVGNNLYDNYKEKLNESVFNKKIISSIIEMINYYRNCIIFNEREEELKNMIIEMNINYFGIVETYTGIIQEIQKNEEIIRNEGIEKEFNEILQIIYKVLGIDQQKELLKNWSEIIQTNTDCILVITLLNQTSAMKENSNDYLEVFQQLLEKSENKMIVMNYLKYIMDIFKSNCNLMYHQNMINKLLPLIIEKDGSMYSSVIEFLSIIPDVSFKYEEIEKEIEKISKNNDNENIILLNKLRIQLIKEKEIRFNEEKISTTIKSIINILTYNSNVTLQKLIITNLSLISIHIDLIPIILPFLNNISNDVEAIILFELIISIISIRRNEISNQIPSILNSVLSIQIQQLFPYISMIFNYIFEFIPHSIYNSLVMTYFINLLNHCDYNEETNVNSFLHTVRSLVDIVDINKITTIFTLSQLTKLHSTITSLIPLVNNTNKEAILYIKLEFENYLTFYSNSTNSNFLF